MKSKCHILVVILESRMIKRAQIASSLRENHMPYEITVLPFQGKDSIFCKILGKGKGAFLCVSAIVVMINK